MNPWALGASILGIMPAIYAYLQETPAERATRVVYTIAAYERFGYAWHALHEGRMQTAATMFDESEALCDHALKGKRQDPKPTGRELLVEVKNLALRNAVRWLEGKAR